MDNLEPRPEPEPTQSAAAPESPSVPVASPAVDARPLLEEHLEALARRLLPRLVAVSLSGSDDVAEALQYRPLLGLDSTPSGL